MISDKFQSILPIIKESGLRFRIDGINNKFYFVKVTTISNSNYFTVEITNNFLTITRGIEGQGKGTPKNYEDPEQFISVIKKCIDWVVKNPNAEKQTSK